MLFGAGVGLVLVIAASWAARRSLPGVLDAINPVNPNNVFKRGADAVTEAVTGDPSFGGWLCDTFGPCGAANDAMRHGIGGPIDAPGELVNADANQSPFTGMP